MESILHFYTIDCIKAGFLRKYNKKWILTKEGEKAIKLGPEKLLSTANKFYREWVTQKEKDNQKEGDVEEENIKRDIGQAQKALLIQYEDIAINGLRNFIVDKNPYEFQDLAAALLDAMGYHISDIAQGGPDGGIDIIAYTDPLGTKQPRIIVQVKHKPNDNISSDEIQKLSGTMKRTSDVGIFVLLLVNSLNLQLKRRETR